MSFASSQIIINQQPNQLYNLGDAVTVPITVVDNYKALSGTINADMLCNGQDINFYKNDISLPQGQPKNLELSFVLINHGLTMINNSLGFCKVKIALGSDTDNLVITNQFKISNLITILKTSSDILFNPGDYFYVAGNATKENGDGVDGFIDTQIMPNDNSTNSSLVDNLGTVSGGNFAINISLPENMAAGTYPVNLKVYEKDANGIQTNAGSFSYAIGIKQVPTSLEIVFANPQVIPGTSLEVKAVLHDQSGTEMNSTSFITIKDSNDKIMEQTQQNTGDFLEFPVNYNQAPAEWNVHAVSSQLTADSTFNILENKKVKIDLVNKTVTITNVGNVPYNNTVVIRIANESFPTDVSLNVDESKKFLMTAPEGGYNIEITTPEGDKVTGMAVLTGKSLNVSEASGEGGIMMFLKQPAIWIFIILVLGVGTFLIFNKTRKKSFFGFMSKERIKKDKSEIMTLSKDKNFTAKTSNKAELSMSIRGEKQEVSIACLKIRNLNEFERQGDVRETLKKISDTADNKDAVLYENQDYLFYVFAPMRTKTFQNEEAALRFAQEASDILNNHNKLYKHKLEFGISLNYGAIIAKQEDTLKIMSLGTIMTSAKKIASLANNEILISENINGKIMRIARTQMETRNDTKVYVLKGLKAGNEEHKKFIENFSKKYEAEKRSHSNNNNSNNNYNDYPEE